MKWDCWYRRGHQYPQAYRGHVLRPSRVEGAFVCWECAHCGENFSLPGEPDRYDLPLMERVDVEELPTDDREAAALVLAMCASTPTEVTEAGDVLGSVIHAEDIAIATFSLVNVGHFALMGEAIANASIGDWSSWFALAESLIRNVEV